ncbi:HD-GYP domain-containing protein [Magnetococcus sp. PR-3]|uniref:HD-GYP domain-containing protein n=1 Tax=Magnetococcus sp. PR-3 TaxID=3120355 RepID=UPI002FCE1FE7
MAQQKSAEALLLEQINALGHEADEEALAAKLPTPNMTKRWNHMREAVALVGQAKSTVSKAIQRIRQGDGVDILSMRSAVKGMVSSIVEDEFSLLSLATLTRKHDRIFSHSINVAVYLMALYKRQGKSEQEIQDIGAIGMLHDIGFAKLPEEIARLGQPSSKRDALIRRSHVELSVTIMQRHGQLKPELADVVAQHHEHLDGSGYPKGIKANQLSWEGRASAIVDAFDHYNATHQKETLRDPKAGLRHLLALSEKKYDRGIVEEFIRCIGVYPVGTVLQLASGAVAVVALTNRDALLFPVIRVVSDRGQAPRASEQLINLAEFQDHKNYKVVKELPATALANTPESYLNL